MIKLRKDVVFEDPEQRIREYCSVEIYHGYDDKHSTNDFLSKEDIDTANKLDAMIDRYDNNESTRLLSHSDRIANTLSKIPNKDLFTIPHDEWVEVRKKIERLLAEFLSVKGIGLAKATKILHLKRPNLFPVLDSLVVKFLLDIDNSEVEKNRQTDIGLRALELARTIMVEHKDAFEKLVKQTRDLPIPLTPVRMFDILCWTTEKWDIRGNHRAPYGTPHRSLLKPFKSEPPKRQAATRTKGRNGYVVFEDLYRATGPKVHHTSCFYYQRWRSNPTSTTKWHGPYKSEEKAWEICKEIASRSGFQPLKHKCVRE